MTVKFIRNNILLKQIITVILCCSCVAIFAYAKAIIIGPQSYLDTPESALWRASIPIIHKILVVLVALIAVVLTILSFVKFKTYSASIQNGNIKGDNFYIHSSEIESWKIESRVGHARPVYTIKLRRSDNTIRQFNILLNKSRKEELFNSLGRSKFRII